MMSGLVYYSSSVFEKVKKKKKYKIKTLHFEGSSHNENVNMSLSSPNPPSNSLSEFTISTQNNCHPKSCQMGTNPGDESVTSRIIQIKPITFHIH